jgi:hypothetical protein
MNAGADKADGQILLFLHADSKLPSGWGCAVEKAIERKGKSADWGCFETIDVVDVRDSTVLAISFPLTYINYVIFEVLQAHPWTKWFLSTSVRIRTRVFHRPYGDQAIFVKRTAFMDCGKYPDDWPLLEDVELVRKLRQRFGGPAIVPMRLSTSGRRWKKLGLFQATVINQIVLLGHALGVPVKQLASLYEQTGPRRQCTWV